MMNGAVARNSAHICLGVCTYQRPEMLLRCLRSLRTLKEPQGVRLSVIVVDNEPEPASLALVTAFPSSDPHIFYVHEPRRGISFARNAVLDKAAELSADWIAMLDDDQYVGDEWLEWMWWATKLDGADVVQCHVEKDMPNPLPVWAFHKHKRRRWRHDMPHASSGGVLFRAGLADRAGQPLRFQERYALTGGEDRDFFTRAAIAGAQIVWTPEAVAWETIPETKLTYAAQVFRTFWMEAVNVRQDIGFHGLAPTLIGKSVKFSGALLGGLLSVTTAPLVALHSERSARKQFLKGSKQIATATGIAVGLVGLQRPEPYRTIHGE